MKRAILRTCVRLGQTSSVACASLLAALATAQTNPPPRPTNPADDEAVQLTPFQVQADPDKSYGALNSNSITAFNVALDRVPVTADIMTEAFMKEVGSLTVEGMLTAYDAGASYGRR